MADSSRDTLPTGRRLRSSAQFCWMRLPTELRLMILEAITQQTCSDWTFAAAVCKEWQHFIEKRRFHRLKLKVPGLDNLERLGIRQRSLVRYISLDIELPTYTCRSCKRTESESWIQRNRKPATGLTLELNAFSPSDSDHWFKSYHFVSDPKADKETPASGMTKDMAGSMANRLRSLPHQRYSGSSKSSFCISPKNSHGLTPLHASSYVDSSVVGFSLSPFRLY